LPEEVPHYFAQLGLNQDTRSLIKSLIDVTNIFFNPEIKGLQVRLRCIFQDAKSKL